MDPCQRLVRHLNRQGAQWVESEARRGPSAPDGRSRAAEPTGGQVEEGAGEPAGSGDRRTCNLRSVEGDLRLAVRVVRDLEDAPFWRSLARDREVVWTGTAAALANQVRQAIIREMEVLPRAPDRGGTGILVLAGEAPLLTLATVSETFRRRHGVWAAALGFHGIWMTASAEDGVFRLDGHLGRGEE